MKDRWKHRVLGDRADTVPTDVTLNAWPSITGNTSCQACSLTHVAKPGEQLLLYHASTSSTREKCSPLVI